MDGSSPAGTTGHRVLLVDDDDDFRAVLRRILVRAGHHVTEARDGLEALARLRLQPAGLLITDLIMPKKEGVETILEVRRTYPETKIIAISGGGRGRGSDHLVIASEVGAHAVLEKPFTFAEILGAIDGVMRAG